MASEYDFRWSSYLAGTLRETVRRLELRPREKLLDIGCGTGALLDAVVRAAPTVSVVGIDLSREMLGVARSKPGPRAALIAGDAEKLPLGPATFDIVVSTSSFHYWRHPGLALAEIARVLRPGGRLVITDWCDDYLACRICDFVLRLVDRSHQQSYSRKECERWLVDAGYDVRVIDKYKINWLWGLMTAKAVRPVAQTQVQHGERQGR